MTPAWSRDRCEARAVSSPIASEAAPARGVPGSFQMKINGDRSTAPLQAQPASQ